MENETNRKEPKEKDVLNDYKEIVKFAHEKIDWVRNVYIWLFGALALIILTGLILAKILIGNNISDMQEYLQKEIEIMKGQVQTRIDQEINKENIRKRIENAVQDKVEEIADPLIKKDVNEMITKKIQPAEKKVADINDSIVELENRVKQTIEQQELLSKDVKLLRLFFDVRRGKRKAFNELQDIALKSTGTQADLANALLDDISLYFEDFKLKGYDKVLISDIGNKINPPAEEIYSAIIDPNLSSNQKRAYINGISERKLYYFVEELVRILPDSDLKVATRAAKAISELANVDFACCPPFTRELDWWEKTGKFEEKYKSPFSKINSLFNLINSGKSDEALDPLLKIVENRKGLADVRFEIAKIYIKQDKRDDAKKQLDIIDTECRGHYNSLILYAAMLAEDGKESEAINKLQEILKFKKDKKEFLNNISKFKVFQSLSTKEEFKKLIKQE